MRVSLHARVVLSGLLGLALLACSSGGQLGGHADSYAWLQDGPRAKRASQGAFSVRWAHQLTARTDSKYVPVEYASAGFDPVRGHIYVGTTDGTFFGFDIDGHRRFRYDAHSPIEAPAAVDLGNGEVYVVSMDSTLHALQADGTLRWTKALDAAARNVPLLTDDAIYVVTATDSVLALSRASGEWLWNHKTDTIEELTISGHAGLVMTDGKLLAAFTSGQVVALHPSDGRVLWQIDTSADVDPPPGDLPQFYDVDTTPAVVGNTVYVASFTAGLYALELGSGTVKWRDPDLEAVVAVRAAAGHLVVSSAKYGVMLYNPAKRSVVWQRPPERGAPTAAAVTNQGTVLFGETKGSLFALTLREGREVARAESGYGFSAAPAVLGPNGAALSNGGKLLMLRLR